MLISLTNPKSVKFSVIFQFNIQNIYVITSWDDKAAMKPDLAITHANSFDTGKYKLACLCKSLKDSSYKLVKYFVQFACFD